MEDSVLTTVKKLIGIPEEDESFDLDIIIHINTVFNILNQIGLDIPTFNISDKTATWTDFLGDKIDLELVKSYTTLKVKSLWDTPTSGAVNTSLENNLRELEWRISVTVDPGRK